MNNSRKLRVCLIQSHPHWGAIEEYLALLANGLSVKGWAVSVIFPESSALAPMIEQLRHDVQQVPLPAHFFRSLRYTFKVRQILRQLQPDIVHCNDPGLVAMSSAYFCEQPHRVLTFHTPSQPFNYRLHAKLLHHWLLRQNWQIVVIASANQTILQHQYKIPDEKIHVIKYGLAPDKFKIADTREAIRTAFAIPPDCVLLGCVGRLAEQKNHALLLNAYAKLPEQLKVKSHLLLVGEGNLRQPLEQQVADLNLTNNVTFTGYRRDIPQLLQAMDGFVLTSNYEGLPFAVLEAMGMGLPILATAVDGIRDAVISGETGWLVPPGQLDHVKDRLADVISHGTQRQQMGQAGRDRFLRHYTVERMVNEMEKLYCKLVGNPADGF